MRNRKPNRLKNYNYSQTGYYFVTICIDKMKCVFGEISNGTMKFNDFGKIASDNLKQIPNIYRNTEINEFVVMPNHIHAIINVGDANFAPPTFTESTSPEMDRTKMRLSKIIQQYKRICTIEIKNPVYRISNGNVLFMIELSEMKKNYLE